VSYQILVYCEGSPTRDTMEPSHRGRRAHIVRLEFIAAGESNRWDGGGPVATFDLWVPHPTSRRRYRKMMSAGEAAEEASVCQTIGPDGRVLDVEAIVGGGDLSALDASHIKLRLSCPLCALDHQFRLETIAPYLDALRRADWQEVSLSALGAILAK